MFLPKTKITVVGIQGSGKTELAKLLTSKFKKPYWYLIHLDDLDRMPPNTRVVCSINKDIKELDKLCEIIIDYAKRGLVDCLIIDETDMFISGNRPLPKHLNDLVINHRHYGLSVIFVTRRPQDIPAKIIESCEHLFIFAMPNSTNIDLKMNAIDKRLLSMMPYLSKANHNFIYKKLGGDPAILKPINLDAMNTMQKPAKIDFFELITEHQDFIEKGKSPEVEVGRG